MVTSMRRSVKVKDDVAAILDSSVSDHLHSARTSWMLYIRLRPIRGDRARGVQRSALKPLLRGEPQHGPCQRFWLARNVQRRGGNHPRPGFPLGETGKGDQIPCRRQLPWCHVVRPLSEIHY